MKRFLDASIMVEACLAQSPKFAAADALVKTGGAVTSAHALAETYATLSGDVRLKINPYDAAQMVGDLRASARDPCAGGPGNPMHRNSHAEREALQTRRPGSKKGDGPLAISEILETRNESGVQISCKEKCQRKRACEIIL